MFPHVNDMFLNFWFMKSKTIFFDNHSEQRSVEESTPPLSTERKHAKYLSILRAMALTLVKTCWSGNLEYFHGFWRKGFHPLILVDVKSTMKHQEWVYTL